MNQCVICGAPIAEDRQVCRECDDVFYPGEIVRVKKSTITGRVTRVRGRKIYVDFPEIGEETEMREDELERI